MSSRLSLSLSLSLSRLSVSVRACAREAAAAVARRGTRNEYIDSSRDVLWREGETGRVVISLAGCGARGIGITEALSEALSEGPLEPLASWKFPGRIIRRASKEGEGRVNASNFPARVSECIVGARPLFPSRVNKSRVELLPLSLSLSQTSAPAYFATSWPVDIAPPRRTPSVYPCNMHANLTVGSRSSSFSPLLEPQIFKEYRESFLPSSMMLVH
jgi:hypothetical protein